MTTPANYLSVLIAHRDELAARAEGKPFSEAVLQCCDSYLKLNEPPCGLSHSMFAKEG